ncbi:S1C family serine protease [Nocardioides sp.]|uniref:S1C family serine protease n=1 Tax=Nocardioides sp. TaxID=35761 RepID=UPI003D09BE08
MTSTPPPDASRTRLRVAGAIALLVAVAVLGGLVGGLLARGDRAGGSPTASVCRAISVAADGLPSVVTISARNGARSGTGSGVIISSEGYILTNNHVISLAADGGRVAVRLDDGRAFATVIVGRDPDTDLAVLKTKDGGELQPIRLATSTGVQVGQPVVALGAPQGLASTVTSGIISALDRNLPIPGDEDNESAQLVGAIQTDASINPGNSGGALVDCSARLIGINTAIITVANAAGVSGGGSVGLGFAIPVDLAMRLADEIIATGRVTHPTFGLETQAQSPGPGLLVTAVAPGGPGARAGLRAGDTITALDGVAVTSPDALVVATLTRSAGDLVEVSYRRGTGPIAKLDVVLEAQP